MYFEFESTLIRIKRLAERGYLDEAFHLLDELKLMYWKIKPERLSKLAYLIYNDLLAYTRCKDVDSRETCKRITKYITNVLTIMDFAVNLSDIQKSMSFSSIIGLRDLIRDYYTEVKSLAREEGHDYKLIVYYITADEDLRYFLCSAFD